MQGGDDYYRSPRQNEYDSEHFQHQHQIQYNSSKSPPHSNSSSSPPPIPMQFQQHNIKQKKKGITDIEHYHHQTTSPHINNIRKNSHQNRDVKRNPNDR